MRFESTAESAPLLALLDDLLQHDLSSRVEQAASVARAPLAIGDEPFAWSVVDTGAVMLPVPLRSAWVLVLRAGSCPEPHRHPNSAQHLRSLHGSGHVSLSTPDGRPGGRWLLDAGHPWLVIGRVIVHAIQVPPAQDWTVVSFHTVPATDLLEVAAAGERLYSAGRADR